MTVTDLPVPMPGAERIAVLRANSIGDFFFALPALEALRARYPVARITLLGQPWHADFLQDRPGPVDDVVPVPPSPGIWGGPDQVMAGPCELHALFERMRAERFDLAVQLHGGGRYSNPFVSNLGAGCTIGMRSAGAPPLDRWVRYDYHQREVLRYLEVVALVHAEPTTVRPRLTVTERDRAEAATLLPARNGGPLVVLHPGANDPRRRWPSERFAAVGDALAARGAHVLVTGHDGDAALADAVVAAMGRPARPVAGLVGLGGLAALLEAATLVVANDTGPRHLAEAVGTATVGIYWLSNAINCASTEVHRHRTLISFRLRCPVCGVDCVQHRCSHDVSFVDDVEVADVLAAAEDLLDLEMAASTGPASLASGR